MLTLLFTQKGYSEIGDHFRLFLWHEEFENLFMISFSFFFFRFFEQRKTIAVILKNETWITDRKKKKILSWTWDKFLSKKLKWKIAPIL